MTTWGEFKVILVHNLDEVGVDFSDPEEGTLDPAKLPMYTQATLWALDTFAISHTALELRLEATVGLNGTIELPSDVLSIRGIYSVPDQLWVQPVMAHPETTTAIVSKTWYEWPKRYVRTTGVEGAVWVDYYSYHPRFQAMDDSVEIKVPLWAEPAILWLTMANILIPTAVSAANLAQFKIKIEAGDPEDNPMLLQVKHFLGQYEWLVAQMTRQERKVYIPK